MNNYQFALILAGVAEITPELADALFSATGGDIELNMRNDVAYLEVDRSATNLQDAVNSVISQVEGAGLGIRVVRVESDVANTIAKINAGCHWLRQCPRITTGLKLAFKLQSIHATRVTLLFILTEDTGKASGTLTPHTLCRPEAAIHNYSCRLALAPRLSALAFFPRFGRALLLGSTTF